MRFRFMNALAMFEPMVTGMYGESGLVKFYIDDVVMFSNLLVEHIVGINVVCKN